jgi:hypothetical protein
MNNLRVRNQMMLNRIMGHRKYFFCFWLLLGFNQVINAQIIYTDIPDATPNASFPLDLNNDNTTDFLIQFDIPYRVKCLPQGNNAYAGYVSGTTYFPWALSVNNTICDTLATWYGANDSGTMAWGNNVGLWVGATNKYLALKFIVGTDTFFGWARFDFLPGSGSFTIKDYAYQSMPNGQILSGQIALGMNEISHKNSFIIYPNPFHSTATIQSAVHLNQASIVMYHAVGQQVNQWDHISGQNISISRENLPQGLYFICIKEGNKILAIEKVNIVE